AAHMKSEHNLTVSNLPDELVIAEQYRFKNSRHTSTRRTWKLPLSGTKPRQRIAREFEGDAPEWQTAVKLLADMLPPIWYFPNFLFELPDRFELTLDETADDEKQDRNRFYR